MESRDAFPADAREWRRFRALQLRRSGWSRRDIAEALGVSPVSVSRWCARARNGGPEALRARPGPGRPPRLTPAQKRLIPEFLWHGAEAYGFRGEVWTCARVALVIEEEFGVRYHEGHVSRLLRELRWTPQVPIRRAIQRDEDAIRHWRDAVWPELLRRARRERRVLDDRFINSPPVTSRLGDRGAEDEGGARTTGDANRTRPGPAVVAGASGPRVSLAPAALRCTSTDTGAPAPDCTPPGTPPTAPRTP